MRHPCWQRLVLDVSGAMRSGVIRPCVLIRPSASGVRPCVVISACCQLGAGERGAMCFNASPAMVKTAGPHVLSALRDH